MPLKHATETVLVFVMGLAVVIAGMALGILPSLRLSIVPWLVLFGLTLAYPLVLYPLLRSRRADYPFRLLHFVPALMVLTWLVFDVLSSYVPLARDVRGVYTWGWTILAVAAAFALIAWFCLSVIRQRVTRLGLLALLLVPFAALAFVSESRQWPDRLAGAMWPRLGVGTEVAALPDTLSGSLAFSSLRSSSSSSSSVQYLIAAASSVRSAAWTEATSSKVSSSISSTTVVAVQPMASSSVSRSPWYQTIFGEESSSVSMSSAASSVSSAVIVAAKPPPKLSSSGPGEVAGLGVMFAAAYCGVLHRRALRRRV